VIISAACLLIGYAYSNSTRDDEIANAVYKEAAKNFEYGNFARLNDASIILSMINSIQNNDNQEFYRKSCLYLKTIYPAVENLGNDNDLSKARRSEIIKDLSAINEFIKEGELNNNCELKAPNDTNT
jgi:hypothetical protein